MIGRANRAFGKRDNAGRERVNKSDIAGRVAERAGVGKSAAGDVVDAVFEAIAEALARGENLRIAGFGAFATADRLARKGRNPRTGEPVSIPASTVPVFKPSKALRDAVNAGGSD